MRKYRGDDAKALKERIRRELGEDAVIVATRQVIEGGVLGFFGRRRVEMVAALPERGEEVKEDDRAGRVDLCVPGEAPSRGGARRGAVGAGASVEIARGSGGADGTVRRAGGAETPGEGRVAAGTRGTAEGEERTRPAAGTAAPFVPLHLTPGIEGATADHPLKAVFLGPAGAGKTSCVGRLAWAHAGAGKRTTVLSLEEEGRLSGVRRWGEFWSALGARYLPCLSLEELLEEALAAEGAVLVDTPPLSARGLPPWCEAVVGRLPGFVRFLVVDACADLEEAASWLALARPLEPYRLVISKADQLFRAERVREIAARSGAETVYVTRDASVDVPPFPLRRGRVGRDDANGEEDTGRTGSGMKERAGRAEGAECRREAR